MALEPDYFDDFRLNIQRAHIREKKMSKLKMKDGVEIYFKDWGKGQPILFCHGWPLSSDMWEYQQMFFSTRGFRTVAFDRRGHGRSDQPWTGYNYDTFADDVASVIDQLDLKDVILVGFSMGGGDVSRYLSRHGTKSVAGAVLMSSVTPYFIKSSNNPNGIEKSVFDGIRDGLLLDHAGFVSQFASLFYGTNRPGIKISDGLAAQTLQIAMQASLKATYDCVTAFSETDFRSDMKAFTIPTLVIHGDDDQVVPLAASGKLTAAMIPGAILKVYKGASHATAILNKQQVNEDLLEFISGLKKK